MAIASSTLALMAAGASAIGAISQGQAAAKQAKFQSAVQRQQAARERQIAESEERDFRKKQSANIAQRRAELGGAGIRSTTGTPLLATEDFLSEAELQAQRIRQGGEVSATRLEQQADLTKAAGKSAQQRGMFRAGSSLLSGVSEFNK
jgi:hypothetical protein